VAPLVGVLGNDEFALAVVMTSAAGIALLALLVAGVSRSTPGLPAVALAVANPA
jgi:DHA1 family bicyclomycin/chloramphenicol resistance-like MFS transporter